MYGSCKQLGAGRGQGARQGVRRQLRRRSRAYLRPAPLVLIRPAQLRGRWSLTTTSWCTDPAGTPRLTTRHCRLTPPSASVAAMTSQQRWWRAG